MAIGIDGTAGNDNLNAVADGNDQIHVRGFRGDDIIRLGFASQITPGNGNEVNGHHAYGSEGSNHYRFENVGNVTSNGVRMVGRIDDFDYSRDTISVDGQVIDLMNPPSNVRIVSHQGQQWLLINNNILYALEGARLDPGASSGEERHFIDWPTAWLNGVPSSADVDFVDQVNYVPHSHYSNLGLPLIYSGAQTINGNESANQIYADKNGGQTGQTIYGNGGNDVINSGQGNDIVYGGSGNDSIAGGLDDDLLRGGSGNDHIWGGSEDDTIKGETGNDRLYGGTGNDDLSGADGHDILYGNDGDDKLFGRNHNDTLFGNDGNDLIHGDAGDDRLYGNDGNDSMRGGSNNDLLRGGNGNDTLRGDSGNDTLKGENGNDLIYGGSGNDELSGANGNDTLKGDSGDDKLFGRNGNDLLRGSDGNDLIQGDAGNDTLWGDNGADVFLFKDGHGDDIIRDFNVNQSGEVIDIRGISAISGFSDLINNHASQSGTDVMIDTGQGNSIRIDDVTISSLSAGDFLF